MASEIESSGEGVVGETKGFAASYDDGEEPAIGCSTNATVGAALLEETDATAPKVGILPTENREVVESREARDPGRRGDGWPVGNWRRMDPEGSVGEDAGGGAVVVDTSGGSVASNSSPSASIRGGDALTSSSLFAAAFFSCVRDA